MENIVENIVENTMDLINYIGKTLFLFYNNRSLYMGILKNVIYKTNEYNIVEVEMTFMDNRKYKTNMKHTYLLVD